MKRTSLTLSILLLFAGGVVSETNEEVKYEMLPLQPPSANPLETAKGLMRCLQLYTAYMINIEMMVCGLHDWENKNKGRIIFFPPSF